MRSILKPSIFTLVDKKNKYFGKWLKGICTGDEVFRISAYFERIFLRKNEYIFLEGKSFEKVFIIEDGEVMIEKKISRFSKNELFSKKKEKLFCNNSKNFSKLNHGIIIYGKNAILGVKEFNEKRKIYFFSAKILKKSSFLCITKTNLRKIIKEFKTFNSVFEIHKKNILEDLNKKFKSSCYWKSICFQKDNNINQKKILNNFIKKDENKNIKKISKLFNNFDNFHKNFINKEQIFFKRQKKKKKFLLIKPRKINMKNTNKKKRKEIFSQRLKNSAINIFNPIINKIYNQGIMKKFSKKNFHKSSSEKNNLNKSQKKFYNSSRLNFINSSNSIFIKSKENHISKSKKKNFFNRKSLSCLKRENSQFIPKNRINLYRFKVSKYKLRNKRLNSSFVKKIQL